MKITVPKQHNFPDSLERKVLKKTGFSVPNWEISVQRPDDVAWSVVLSFLISADFRDPDDFARRLEALTGSKNKLNTVKKAIRIFNPFRNRHSCFFNEDLKQVVDKFKHYLNWNNLPTVSDKLSEVSKKLECPVILIWKDKACTPNIYRHQIHFKSVEKKFNIIALNFIECTNENNISTGRLYNFLLGDELGIRLKFASLRYFLKKAEIPRKISKKVESIVKEGEHFLISLLYSDYKEVILTLYSSAYFVSKLKEADFDTDPSSKDSGGFSALHHALALGQTEILSKLYFFSANNCCQTEGSYSNPDSGIVSNFHHLDEVLSGDLAKFEFFKRHPNYGDIKKTYDNLLKFNKFLTELSAKILKIKSKLNYFESTEEIMFEASKRRDVILCVLDTYVKYFWAVPSVCVVESPCDDYIENLNYYNSIDMATAVIFFSNIISLKERLLLACKNEYSQVEISLYQTIFYHYLSDRIQCIDFKNILMKDIFKFSFIFILLIRRFDNLKKITAFRRNLGDAVINRDNVKKCIPQGEILSIFKTFPMYKNLMHLDRLKCYIDSALKIKVIDEKSVLVIQRALQVIGEYTHKDNDDDDSFRRFLVLVLPKETCRVLLRVRNELSHLKSYACKLKFEWEKKFSLFRSIQEEIRSINQNFSIVYKFYEYIECLEFLSMVEGEMEKVETLKHSCYSPAFVSATFVKVVFLQEQHCTFLRNRNLFKELFEIILPRVENEIVKEIKWNEDIEQVKKKVLSTLWPLKWLIELLEEFDKSINIKILDVLETMKTRGENNDSVNDLQVKAQIFIEKCKILLNNFKSKCASRRKRKTPSKPIDMKNIEHFLNILKGFTYLSNEQKEEIRSEIPEKVKLDVITVKKLKESVPGGFTLIIDEKDPKFQISYFSKQKLRKMFDLYNKKSQDVLSKLEVKDPISELEEVFSTNLVNQKRFEPLCEIMQFSDKTKKLLENLVAGQRKKTPANDLHNLLNRIKLLNKIVIEDNDEIQNLRLKVKSKTSKKYVVDRILWYYVRDHPLQAAVEMLLLDCMSIFKNQRGTEKLWVKSSNLYCGINMRNIISHGNPFLDNLCELLDPDDVELEMIQKTLRLIDDMDAIQAILELYESLNGNFTLLQIVINDEEKGEYTELRNRILKCDEWKGYTLLLPFKQTTSENGK